MIDPDPNTHLDKATGAELLAFLRERGHLEIDGKPIEKELKNHGRAALTGVVQLHRIREWER